MICRQIEERQLACQLFLPVLHLGVPGRFLLLLPNNKVAELKAKCRQYRIAFLYKSLSQLHHFLRQHPNRPSVKDDVVHNQNQRMFVRRGAYDRSSEERTAV